MQNKPQRKYLEWVIVKHSLLTVWALGIYSGAEGSHHIIQDQNHGCSHRGLPDVVT